MRARESHMGHEQHPTVHIREQNTGELQEVVANYLPALYRSAYRYVGDTHDAEDAVQEALLSAYKHLDQFKRTAKMTTWLTTIVRNSALMQLRKRPRHPHVSLDERATEDHEYCVSDWLADLRPSPEGACIGSELHGNLMKSVKKLSPSLRKVIQLRHMDGLTTGEAAQILGLSEGTVKAQVSRARTKLKRLMREV